MFSRISLRRAAAVIAFSALSAVPGSAQETVASYVVLASTAPDFTVGQLVEDSATLEVPQGASLTLIDPVGQIRVLQGPFLGRLRIDPEDQSEPSFINDLASIIAQADATDVSLGMGRSTLAPEVSPWLVAMDDSLPGDLCVSPEGQLVFHRGNADREGRDSISFAAADGTGEAVVTWGEGDDLLRWPEALPLVDGAVYLLAPGVRGATAVSEAAMPVTLHLTPPDLGTDAHVAVWLAQTGCELQAEAMVRRMTLGG